jgi:2-iminobutanoate/2-iminopropanoate deaminase
MPTRKRFTSFENLKKIVSAGGMDLGDVVKITVFPASESHRNAVVKRWEQCYPDPHPRPARHALVVQLRGEGAPILKRKNSCALAAN